MDQDAHSMGEYDREQSPNQPSLKFGNPVVVVEDIAPSGDEEEEYKMSAESGAKSRQGPDGSEGVLKTGRTFIASKPSLGRN